MSEWENKVAIVTGASSGIGIGIAIEFAKHGCSLALVGRNEKNLKDTAEKCAKQGLDKEKMLCIIADMFIDEDVKSIVTKTVNKFGKINVLVNNAAIFGKFVTLPDFDMKEFDNIMRVNVKAVVLLSQEAVPHLIKTKGNIVNISSAVASGAWPKMTLYAMSKAAIDHFTRCSAVDLISKGVRINSIQPGITDTNIFERSGTSKDDKEKLISMNISQHPMGRLGTPEDIGRSAVFLASDNSCFTTGQTICINGGFLGCV